MPEAVVIAIVGAESTGKTALAQALAQQLQRSTGSRCTWVGEWLRHWCDAQGRTPLPHEQEGIARHQQSLIDGAAAAHDIVVCDTTPLMTALYSALLFDDHTLVPWAVAQHRRSAHTLLTALDLPWVSDGLQRDGPHVREPVDRLLRQWLAAHGLRWSLVSGAGPARLQSALTACAPLWPAGRDTPGPGQRG